MVKHIESKDEMPIIFGEELPTGVYLIEVTQGTNQKTLKLMKE